MGKTRRSKKSTKKCMVVHLDGIIYVPCRGNIVPKKIPIVESSFYGKHIQSRIPSPPSFLEVLCCEKCGVLYNSEIIKKEEK